MATSARISFGIFDVTAKADSTPAATDKQPWVNINDLKQDELTQPTYATLEGNQFILDGTLGAVERYHEWG